MHPLITISKEQIVFITKICSFYVPSVGTCRIFCGTKCFSEDGLQILKSKTRAQKLPKFFKYLHFFLLYKLITTVLPTGTYVSCFSHLVFSSQLEVSDVTFWTAEKNVVL
jgi:hypothetical protein